MIDLPRVFERQGWIATLTNDGNAWTLSEWIGPGVQPDQAAIDAAAASLGLEDSRDAMRRRFRDEAVRRIGLQVADWNTFERIQEVAALGPLLNWAGATTAQTVARDIYLRARDVYLPHVAVTDQQGLEGLTPEADSPGGGLAAWPDV